MAFWPYPIQFFGVTFFFFFEISVHHTDYSFLFPKGGFMKDCTCIHRAVHIFCWTLTNCDVVGLFWFLAFLSLFKPFGSTPVRGRCCCPHTHLRVVWQCGLVIFFDSQNTVFCFVFLCPFPLNGREKNVALFSYFLQSCTLMWPFLYNDDERSRSFVCATHSLDRYCVSYAAERGGWKRGRMT